MKREPFVPNPIVALALVTRKELDLLGPQFDRAYPIDETPCFGELLQAIDLADRQIWQERDKANADRTDTLMISVIDRS